MLSFQGVKHLNVSACLTWQNRKTQISIFDSFILNMFICTSFVILKNIKITRCVCFGLIWTGSYLSGLSDVWSILGEHLIHYGVVIETNFSNSKECVCVCRECLCLKHAQKLYLLHDFLQSNLLSSTSFTYINDNKTKVFI